jgi:SAM-dependent methyltransferase
MRARKPPAARANRAAVSLRLRLADAADAALGRRPALTPPRRLQRLAGDSDFHQTGAEFGRLLTDVRVLAPSDRVLDIGCGAGRIARILAPRLEPPGSYDGFDVIPEAVAWCQRHYPATAVPFRFHHADIHNAIYNPGGSGRATEYRFPCAERSCDLVLAISVFTHLLSDAAEHYLAEAARVMAPGGRLFSTWFLLRGDRGAGGGSALRFSHAAGPAAAVADPELPEAAVAYDVEWVTGRLRALGLEVREPVLWGTWAGEPGTSFQDIVIARRAGERRGQHRLSER